ncbi:MAG: hypothetical protein MJE68_29045, partial [Proteobacteria bacterium]|nr:hypothetical protein [Pseudomonadota bacterium]
TSDIAPASDLTVHLQIFRNTAVTSPGLTARAGVLGGYQTTFPAGATSHTFTIAAGTNAGDDIREVTLQANTGYLVPGASTVATDVIILPSIGAINVDSATLTQGSGGTLTIISTTPFPEDTIVLLEVSGGLGSITYPPDPNLSPLASLTETHENGTAQGYRILFKSGDTNANVSFTTSRVAGAGDITFAVDTPAPTNAARFAIASDGIPNYRAANNRESRTIMVTAETAPTAPDLTVQFENGAATTTEDQALIRFTVTRGIDATQQNQDLPYQLLVENLGDPTNQAASVQYGRINMPAAGLVNEATPIAGNTTTFDLVHPAGANTLTHGTIRIRQDGVDTLSGRIRLSIVGASQTAQTITIGDIDPIMSIAASSASPRFNVTLTRERNPLLFVGGTDPLIASQVIPATSATVGDTVYLVISANTPLVQEEDITINVNYNDPLGLIAGSRPSTATLRRNATGVFNSRTGQREFATILAIPTDASKTAGGNFTVSLNPSTVFGTGANLASPAYTVGQNNITLVALTPPPPTLPVLTATASPTITNNAQSTFTITSDFANATDIVPVQATITGWGSVTYPTGNPTVPNTVSIKGPHTFTTSFATGETDIQIQFTPNLAATPANLTILASDRYTLGDPARVSRTVGAELPTLSITGTTGSQANGTTNNYTVTASSAPDRDLNVIIRVNGTNGVASFPLRNTTSNAIETFTRRVGDGTVFGATLGAGQTSFDFSFTLNSTRNSPVLVALDPAPSAYNINAGSASVAGAVTSGGLPRLFVNVDRNSVNQRETIRYTITNTNPFPSDTNIRISLTGFGIESYRWNGGSAVPVSSTIQTLVSYPAGATTAVLEVATNHRDPRGNVRFVLEGSLDNSYDRANTDPILVPFAPIAANQLQIGFSLGSSTPTNPTNTLNGLWGYENAAGTSLYAQIYHDQSNGRVEFDGVTSYVVRFQRTSDIGYRVRRNYLRYIGTNNFRARLDPQPTQAGLNYTYTVVPREDRDSFNFEFELAGDNNIDEANGVYTVSVMSNASADAEVLATASYTIVDNDPTIELAADTTGYAAGESIELTVQTADGSPVNVDNLVLLDWITRSPTPISALRGTILDSFAVGAASRVTIPAGESSATVSVPVLDNAYNQANTSDIRVGIRSSSNPRQEITAYTADLTRLDFAIRPAFGISITPATPSITEG